jgi:hypothetical protein
VQTVSLFSVHGESSSRPRSTHDVHLAIHVGTSCSSGHKIGSVGEALGLKVGDTV